VSVAQEAPAIMRKLVGYSSKGGSEISANQIRPLIACHSYLVGLTVTRWFLLGTKLDALAPDSACGKHTMEELLLLHIAAGKGGRLRVLRRTGMLDLHRAAVAGPTARSSLPESDRE